MRRLPRARLELAAELADRQRHRTGQVGQRDRLGEPHLHQVPHGGELTPGQPRLRLRPPGRRPHAVITPELRRQQHGQMIDVGARGRLPRAQDTVKAENKLLDKRIRTPQLFRQLYPAVLPRRLPHRVLGEVHVHRPQVAAEFHRQVMGRRVQEHAAGRHSPRAAELAMPTAHRDRPVEMQDQLMRPGRAEARLIRPFCLRGHVQPLPAEAGARPRWLDPRLAQDAVGVGQAKLRHRDLPPHRRLRIAGNYTPVLRESGGRRRGPPGLRKYRSPTVSGLVRAALP